MNEPLIRNRNIVIVGQQPWDTEIGSNCKDIALEFSKHNKVLYINPALDRITLLKHRTDPKIKKRINIIKGKENGLVKISSNLWNLFPDVLVESVNRIGISSIFDLLNKRNNKLFAKSIIKALSLLNFNNIILFNDNDIFRSFYLKNFLQPSFSIYYSRDYMIAVDYWKRHGERLEPELIAKSDACAANSTYLADYCRKYNKNSFYVGQGCNLGLFGTVSGGIPAEISYLKGPVIGYVGALQSIRLDIDILEHIALSKPEWNIVLVGPEDDVFKASRLHQIENIHFSGAKKPEELPLYIHAFDVCLNPQIINEITIGNYPRKIDEYLAMGKPVVATRTQAIDIFKDYIYMAADKDDFVGQITKGLDESNLSLNQRRKDFAASHTWENSVAEIYKVIHTLENKA